MHDIIETSHLTKFYGNVCGIINLNLTLKKGELFGFLGPNGAGKSTTIRLILNLIRPTSGDVKIFGKDLKRNYKYIFERIGYIPGELKLYEDLSGDYFLKYMSRFNSGSADLTEKLLLDFQLTREDLQKKIKYYSHGMKQKLGIIQALQSDPDLLIMDEPSEGLDPINKNILYSYLIKFKEKGKTIFFSSHNLSEVEKICNRIGLVKEGKLIALETLESLRNKMIRVMKVEFNHPIKDEELSIPGIKKFQKDENIYKFTVLGDMNPVIAFLARHSIKKLVFPEPTLEDMFMSFYK